MKTFTLLAVIALTAGQQFKERRDFNTAVRLAGPGFFGQGGSFNSRSSSADRNQFQSDSSQNRENFQNQGGNFQSSSFSGARRSGQSGSFQTGNQFQSGSSSSFGSANRDQFQTRPIQQNIQTSFSSNTFKQDRNTRFQSSNSDRSTPQANTDSRIQSSFAQQTTENRFQTPFSQQEPNRRFQSINIQLTPSRRFQSSSRQQTSFQPARNQEDNSNQFRQTTTSQRISESRLSSGRQPQSLSRFTSISQSQPQPNTFQTNTFQRSGSPSAGSFSDVSGVFEPLNLPSGASLLLGSIDTSFTCADRPYGYYADEDNSCRVFHVCNPALFSDGEIQTYQYSFMCGEGTVFDQNEMTCKMDFEATPCQEASNYYYRNEQFGRPEERSF
ncbi:hypothetical protein SK128_004556 [Halocaridina rubra]|uniref:Chitin-binding type-2 domain-containing protein n=1 Tax=Halocaridina rubra TaxID=373956 RepID=A0AAN8WDC0_HALRR